MTKFDLIPCLNDNPDHIKLFGIKINTYKMNLDFLFKSLHLISVISDGGTLYLPRIFVYHAEADEDSIKFLKLLKENFIILL